MQGIKLTFVIVLFLVFRTGYAQVADETASFGQGSVEYKRQILGGPYLHSNGIGASIAFGKHTTGFKRRMLRFDLATLKHPKEVKSYNLDQNSKGFVFGKMNGVLLLKPSFGYKTVKFDKLRSSGVEVGYTWSAGPTLAFLKPVYLEIIKTEGQRYILTQEQFSEENQNRIYGRASAFKGIDEMKIVPGASFRAAMFFEYSTLRDGIRALEVGTSVDLFPKDLYILANEENKSIFVNFYVQLLFGKKYIQ